jgi:glyceraldehyde-3-phosphate dehydrogenase/erythrose-4-phosphate dehydrogenase
MPTGRSTAATTTTTSVATLAAGGRARTSTSGRRSAHDGIRPLVKVFGWYDNEWGYANRLAELALVVGDRR